MDSLGRTRTCLRADVPYYKTLDSKLRMDESSSQEPKEDQNPKIISEELLLWDQKREELRKMWEEEENRLSQKRDIHYSDILFNGIFSVSQFFICFKRDVCAIYCGRYFRGQNARCWIFQLFSE